MTERDILRSVLVEDDALHGVIRNQEALEKQLDYLTRISPEPYWAKEEEFQPLKKGE